MYFWYINSFFTEHETVAIVELLIPPYQIKAGYPIK